MRVSLSTSPLVRVILVLRYRPAARSSGGWKVNGFSAWWSQISQLLGTPYLGNNSIIGFLEVKGTKRWRSVFNV